MDTTTSPALAGERSGGQLIRLPAELRGALDEALARAVDDRWAERLWARDVSLWTDDEDVAGKIANRLGWLDAPREFGERTDELRAFADTVAAEGLTSVVLCGMGGSSLAPEVLDHSFARSASGIPLTVLDSTDPQALRAATAGVDLAHRLFLIASKSGTTTETLAFLAHFWEAVDDAHRGADGEVGRHFVAISDPGRSVAAIPHQESFREVFLNPEDVGGRYSALTYVGLVPAALIGLELDELLRDAQLMADRCRSAERSNPGLWLGVALAALARQGRDKLTFVIEPELASFGAWAEQLIAESTGKHGTGVVPVDGEPLGDPAVYGFDRTFVRLGRASSASWRQETGALLDQLADAGHPVIDLALEGGEWLGGEFFRWEFATAICGAGLGIDPFDEPNVTESKDNTRRVLEAYAEAGRLPEGQSLVSEGRLTFYGDAPLRLTDPADSGDMADGARLLRRHLERVRPDGYLAIQAYVAPTPERDRTLRHLQARLRDASQHATTLGYGPRFLHSTGQLHKGGTPSGCFLQLVSQHPADLPIPGGEETFGVLIGAQALGDFTSLESHDLPVMRIDLSDDPDAGLTELMAAIDRALA